jgi:two-component system alkaline phosphatase synthesis response regulator PhoP
VREDGLLSLAKGGVVFAPGPAGTIQEIFQDLTQNHYGTLGSRRPWRCSARPPQHGGPLRGLGGPIRLRDPMPRILVVEDDPSISRGLEMNLQLEGFETVAAADGREALEKLEGVDLVILDIMLPHMNGYQVCARLRAEGHDMPVILLSAKSAEVDIVRGLELGADDYVTKPFRLAELLARVKAHLRRRAPSDGYRFGDVEVDLASRLVRRAGQMVELTEREYDLLVFLIEREGKAVTRDAILLGVWGQGYFGTDRTVDNFITRLRQKLDTPGEPLFFHTVRGVGYRFVADAGP